VNLFLKLEPREFVEKLYISCDYDRIFEKYFKNFDKRCNMIYIVNDRNSYNKLIQEERNISLIDIASMSLKNHMKNPIMLTDCVFCNKICSILLNYSGYEELSSIWGICKSCHTEKYNL